MKVLDLDLGAPLPTLTGLDRFVAVQALVRLHGVPLGYARIPVTAGRCSAEELRREILDKLGWHAIRHLLDDRLAWGLASAGGSAVTLPDASHADAPDALPSLTIAICTRDRPEGLARCLEAVEDLDYPELEVIVVDNAPSNDATESLVRARHPRVRYIREPRPGLDWARNRAVGEARGEVIAFTDDDVIVDSGWALALGRVFAEAQEVGCVTGLVAPYELDTEAQVLYEAYGGFGRGFRRRWFKLEHAGDSIHIGSGRFGTGANMAFRRRVLEDVGGFDPALDVGTVTNGGGDLEMFFRVLQEGHTLVYEPSAIVHHLHRREYELLHRQLTDNGIGFYSYLVRSALAYPGQRRAIVRFGAWWLWWWNLRRLLISVYRPSRFPRDLILAELGGCFVGLLRYPRARREAARIARAYSGRLPSVRNRSSQSAESR